MLRDVAEVMEATLYQLGTSVKEKGLFNTLLNYRARHLIIGQDAIVGQSQYANTGVEIGLEKSTTYERHFSYGYKVGGVSSLFSTLVFFNSDSPQCDFC